MPSAMNFDPGVGGGENAGNMAAVLFQEREVLNVMDYVGCLWQITVEGSRIKVVKSIPTLVCV